MIEINEDTLQKIVLICLFLGFIAGGIIFTLIRMLIGDIINVICSLIKIRRLNRYIKRREK